MIIELIGWSIFMAIGGLPLSIIGCAVADSIIPLICIEGAMISFALIFILRLHHVI